MEQKRRGCFSLGLEGKKCRKTEKKVGKGVALCNPLWFRKCIGTHHHASPTKALQTGCYQNLHFTGQEFEFEEGSQPENYSARVEASSARPCILGPFVNGVGPVDSFLGAQRVVVPIWLPMRVPVQLEKPYSAQPRPFDILSLLAWGRGCKSTLEKLLTFGGRWPGELINIDS